MGRRRFRVSDVTSDTYSRLYDFLYEDEFRSLSNDARCLYAQLRRRHEASMKNGWTNENGDVFLVYSREDMEKMIGLTDKTVKRAIERLKAVNLIEEERLGMGRCNRIYLLYVTDDKNLETEKPRGRIGKSPIHESESVRYRTGKFPGQESEDFRHLQQELDKYELDKSIHPSEVNPDADTALAFDGLIDKIKSTDFEGMVRENVEYEALQSSHPGREALIDDLIALMVEVLENPAPTVRVGKQNMPAEKVKGQLLRVRMEHVDYVLFQLDETKPNIKNIRAYMITTLINALSTKDLYWHARVNRDMKGGS